MRNEVNTKIDRKYRLPLNLQTFSELEDDPNDPPAEPTPEPKTVTMTQEELDAIIDKRIGKVKRQYADYDELKTKVTEHEKAEAERKLAAMTETERLQAEIEAAKKAAEDAEKAREQALTAANQRLLKAEYKSLAGELGIRKDALDDAFTLLDKNGITFDGDDVGGIREAIQALVDAKPYLLEKAKPRNIGEPNNPPPNGEKSKEQRLKDAADKAKRSGRIEDMAAYGLLKRELEG